MRNEQCAGLPEAGRQLLHDAESERGGFEEEGLEIAPRYLQDGGRLQRPRRGRAGLLIQKSHLAEEVPVASHGEDELLALLESLRDLDLSPVDDEETFRLHALLDDHLPRAVMLLGDDLGDIPEVLASAMSAKNGISRSLSIMAVANPSSPVGSPQR